MHTIVHHWVLLKRKAEKGITLGMAYYSAHLFERAHSQFLVIWNHFRDQKDPEMTADENLLKNIKSAAARYNTFERNM